MPNFDAGTYFLTSLAPIKSGGTVSDSGETISWIEKLRAALSILPTAMQSPATIAIGRNSPFAQDRQTHFCRFVIINDVISNGRPATSTLANSLTGGDPIHPLPEDRLTSAYLLFAADFDAVTTLGDPLPTSLSQGDEDAVRDAYAKRLWSVMPDELKRIYGCCEGFDEVETAEAFANYISRTQVETTMPFHDYWISPPALKSLPVLALIFAAGLPFAVFLFSLISFIFGADTPSLLGSLVPWPSWVWTLGGLVLTIAAIYGIYRYVLGRGQQPMPPPQYGDLRTVLKSMYLQQTFTQFASDIQGADDQHLFDAFGAFMAEHDPDNLDAPTQAAGTLSLRESGTLVKGSQP